MLNLAAQHRQEDQQHLEFVIHVELTTDGKGSRLACSYLKIREGHVVAARTQSGSEHGHHRFQISPF